MRRKKTLLTALLLACVLCFSIGIVVFSSLAEDNGDTAKAISYADAFYENELVKIEDNQRTPDYQEDVKTGTKITFRKSTTLRYKSIVNIADNDLTKPLFSLIFSPTQQGTQEFSELKFIFTDCFDENNKVTFRISSPGPAYPNETCVSVYGGEQVDYIIRWQTYRTSMFGQNQNRIDVYLDYETLSAYVAPGSQWTDNMSSLGLARNLTLEDGTQGVAGKEKPWEGVKTGYCYLDIAGKNLAADASFILFSIDETDFTKKAPSVADDKVELLLDYDGYDENTLPVGIKGKKYPVINCDCYTFFEGKNSNIIPLVVKQNGETVPVIDGMFTTEEVGNYFLLYEGINGFGGKRTCRLKIKVLESYEDEIDYEFNPLIPSECKEREAVHLFSGVATGGSGRLTISNTLTDASGKKVSVLNENGVDIFVPETAGTYTLKTTVNDFLNTVRTFEKQITVNTNEDIIDVATVPKGIGRGEEFIIPSYKCIDSGKTVKVYVDGTEITNGKYTHNGASDSFVLKYVAGTYEESYTVNVVDLTEATGFMKNYFVCENGGETSFNDESELQFVSHGGNSSFTFIRKISMRYFEIAFKLDKNKSAYSSINLYLQDSENPDMKIKASISFVNEKFYFTCCGNTVEMASPLYTGVGVIGFDNNKLAFVENGTSVLCNVNATLDERLFKGFGDSVYLTFEYQGVTGDSNMILSSIGNHVFNKKKVDTTKPVLYYDVTPSFATSLAVGSKKTLSKVYAYDVLQPKTTTSVKVTYEVVNGEDKTEELKYEGAGDSGSEFTFDTVGTYYVTYIASDANGNKLESRKTVYVIDNVPPEITLKKYKETADLAKDYTLPTFTVTDNSSEVSTYIIIRYCTGYEELAKGETYNFRVAGKHTVRIVAFDVDGNMSAVEYLVEVK